MALNVINAVGRQCEFKAKVVKLTSYKFKTIPLGWKGRCIGVANEGYTCQTEPVPVVGAKVELINGKNKIFSGVTGKDGLVTIKAPCATSGIVAGKANTNYGYKVNVNGVWNRYVSLLSGVSPIIEIQLITFKQSQPPPAPVVQSVPEIAKLSTAKYSAQSQILPPVKKFIAQDIKTGTIYAVDSFDQIPIGTFKILTSTACRTWKDVKTGASFTLFDVNYLPKGIFVCVK